MNQTKLYNAEEQLDDVKDAINEAALSQIPWQMTKWMMRNGVKAEKSSFEEDDKEQQQVFRCLVFSFLREFLKRLMFH